MPAISMSRRLHLAAFAAIAFSLAGCATPPAPIPPELQYREPQLAPDNGSIVGSQEDSSWADNFTAYVFAVDGKRVMVGRKGWNVPLSLPPGARKVTVQFNRGVFAASAELSIDVAPGAVLELKYSTDVGFNGKNSYCDFWIVDTKTGKAVTEVVRGPVGGHTSSTYIPIFIPRK